MAPPRSVKSSRPTSFPFLLLEFAVADADFGLDVRAGAGVAEASVGEANGGTPDSAIAAGHDRSGKGRAGAFGGVRLNPGGWPSSMGFAAFSAANYAALRMAYPPRG